MIEREFTHFGFCCGIGGGSAGFNDSRPSVGTMTARWRCLGGIGTDMGLLNPGIDWVVVGGESGPKARPMHPDWTRSLRDQCAAAGVPFLLKQWGEWLPIDQGKPDWYDYLYRSRVVAKDGESQTALDDIHGRKCTVPELCLRIDGEHTSLSAPGAFQAGKSPVQAFRIGRKAAGRLLDGRLHDEYPNHGRMALFQEGRAHG